MMLRGLVSLELVRSRYSVSDWHQLTCVCVCVCVCGEGVVSVCVEGVVSGVCGVCVWGRGL